MTGSEHPRRPRYREGQVLELCDLAGEQDYRVGTRHRHEVELHDGDPSFDETRAPGTGKRIVAAAVQAHGDVEMMLEPVFAVRVPDARQGTAETLHVTADGTCVLASPLTATGVTADVLRIGPAGEQPVRAMPWHWHRPGGADGRECRVELEPPLIPGAADRSRFVVGLSSGPAFDPVLTVDAGGNTAVRGRLAVRGPVVRAAPAGAPADAPALGVSVRLGQEHPPLGRTPVDVLAMNLSPELIRTPTVLLVTDSGEPRVVTTQPVIRGGDVLPVAADVDSAARRLTATVFGVLPGGVLCHASAVLDLS